MLLGFTKNSAKKNDEQADPQAEKAKENEEAEELVNKEMHKTHEELKAMRRKVFQMRNTLCDYYATKYSSE